MISIGSMTVARASATRRACPPESSPGILARGIAQTNRMQLHQHEIPDHRLGQIGVLPQREGDIFEDGHVGKERAELEEKPHAAPQRIELALVHVGHQPTPHLDLASLRPQLPGDEPQ